MRFICVLFGSYAGVFCICRSQFSYEWPCQYITLNI